MPRALVVYASPSGCTASIAEVVADTLEAVGAGAETADVRKKPDPQGYDAVIVGSGVRDRAWHPNMRAWLRTRARRLRTIPMAAFSVGLYVTRPDKRKEALGYSARALGKAQLAAVATGLFTGWSIREEFPWYDRLMLGRKVEEGDWRDFGTVASWAKEATVPLQLQPFAD